jgi:ABC-type multidrug transport system ATPase subunit
VIAALMTRAPLLVVDEPSSGLDPLIIAEFQDCLREAEAAGRTIFISLQADRYLARRLRDLDDQQLTDLDTRQEAILDNPPPFDPSALEGARQRQQRIPRAPRDRKASTAIHQDDAQTRQLRVLRLEAAAQAHRDWRRTATKAQAIRRQVGFEQRRRSSSRTRWPAITRSG